VGTFTRTYLPDNPSPGSLFLHLLGVGWTTWEESGRVDEGWEGEGEELLFLNLGI